MDCAFEAIEDVSCSVVSNGERIGVLVVTYFAL
jgi:hypothetical protein